MQALVEIRRDTPKRESQQRDAHDEISPERPTHVREIRTDHGHTSTCCDIHGKQAACLSDWRCHLDVLYNESHASSTSKDMINALGSI